MISELQKPVIIFLKTNFVSFLVFYVLYILLVIVRETLAWKTAAQLSAARAVDLLDSQSGTIATLFSRRYFADPY